MLLDSFNRIHDYLRVSVTGACNLACQYCNPAGANQGVEHIVSNEENLSVSEIHRLLKIFIEQGKVKKFRFTGGEPLIRKELPEILAPMKDWKEEFQLTLALSTNGTLLQKNIPMLLESGIDFLNISLDSLNRNRFQKITGRDALEKVLIGIDSALQENFQKIKLNVVLMNGINDDDSIEIIERFIDTKLNIRFIEYMPIGKINWNRKNFLESRNLEEKLKDRFKIFPIQNGLHETAKNYAIPNHSCEVSFITPMSEHFCDNCNRLRLTASGKLRLCLFSPINDGLDLGNLLKENLTENEILERMQKYLPTKWDKHPPMEELANLETSQMIGLGG